LAVLCPITLLSVLGPVLFNIYIRSLYDHVTPLGFTIEGYADNHQVYINFSPAFQRNVLTYDIKHGFTVISTWMHTHFLYLNSDKTEIILIGPKSTLNHVHIGGVILNGDTCIRFKNTAKNLGFTFDSQLQFDTQINNIISSCYVSLRNIYRMKQFLSTKQLTILCNSLILSKLDYANSLYYGINNSLLTKLQMVQNSAARMVFGRRRSEHVTDLIKNLHWLKVRERIYFKVILMVFKCIHGTAPEYLCNMLIRISTHNVLLIEPRVKSHFGERSFHKCAPKLWNNLPSDLRNTTNVTTFKRKLKHYLFNNSVEFHSKLQIV